jgi:transposase
MTTVLNLEHERVDDIPLIIGLCNRLGLPDILDRHLGTHGHQQGLNNGQLATGWLGYILSQADHRKSAVQEWADGLQHTLGKLLGQPIRSGEFNDDRLGGVLARLSNDEAWVAIERELWAATVTVYEMALTGVRLDSTTSYGYHQVQDGGLMQYGHSKDHRPDLPQLKLMAAAAEPSGHVIASDVLAGQQADDPLYVPMIKRVRDILGQSGLLYAGDAKMAALSTRAYIIHGKDDYLVPLPMTGDTATSFLQWLDAVVDGAQCATLVWDQDQLVAAGYEFSREQSAVVDDKSVTWMERVLMVRSTALAERDAKVMMERLTQAEAKLNALTPEPGRGKRQFRQQEPLQATVEALLTRYDAQGLLTVAWERQEHHVTRYLKPGKPTPDSPTRVETQVRYVITSVQRDETAIQTRHYRLGWRAYATSAAQSRLPFAQAIQHYRQGWCLEQDFHLVKDAPLGLSPLFVWQDDQIKGLVRLLTLALRLLTLIETQVRQGLTQDQAVLSGLYEGQPSRTTDRPTGKRILKAFVRANITLTGVTLDSGQTWHITPLSALHQKILAYLRLPILLYTHGRTPLNRGGDATCRNWGPLAQSGLICQINQETPSGPTDRILPQFRLSRKWTGRQGKHQRP